MPIPKFHNPKFKMAGIRLFGAGREMNLSVIIVPHDLAVGGSVVGPSAVGKDSMMQTLAGDNPRLALAHSVKTGAANVGGEGLDRVDEIVFVGALLRGRLCCMDPATANPIPAGITVHIIDNSAVLSQIVQCLHAALYPAPAHQVTQG